MLLAVLSAVFPLAFIALAVTLSGWFNIYNNALSDLGHSTRSNVASIFNFGLSVGGFMVATVGEICALKGSKPIGVTLLFTGFCLVLIAVFDEVYGRLHFYVSVAFFLSIAILLLEYTIVQRSLTRRLLSLSALIIAVLSWVSHLIYGIPRGAAIPELVSIVASLPFYFDYIRCSDTSR